MFHFILSSLLCTLLLATNVAAQPVQVVLGASPGGFAHRYAADLLPLISKAAGKPAVIDFRPGAAGQVAAKHVLSKKSSEITILLGTAHKWENAEVSQLDLLPIAYLGTSPAVIVTRPNDKYQTYAEFLEYSKTHKTSYGTVASSPNSHYFHIASEGTLATDVPYKSGGAVLADVLGGHVDIGITVVDAVADLITQGKLIPLGILGKARTVEIPNALPLFRQGISVPHEERYFNNVFLWVNPSADKHAVEKFRMNLLKQLATREARDIFYNRGIQFNSRQPKDAQTFLTYLIK